MRVAPGARARLARPRADRDADGRGARGGRRGAGRGWSRRRPWPSSSVVLAVAGLRGGSGGAATAAPPTVVSAFCPRLRAPRRLAARRHRRRLPPQPHPARRPTAGAEPDRRAGESRSTSPDPQSARTQLLAGFEAARTAGGGVSDLQPDTTFAGRQVATYRQVAGPGTTVEWVVVFAGTTQLSVGCRHDDPERRGSGRRLRPGGVDAAQPALTARSGRHAERTPRQCSRSPGGRTRPARRAGARPTSPERPPRRRTGCHCRGAAADRRGE